MNEYKIYADKMKKLSLDLQIEKITATQCSHELLTLAAQVDDSASSAGPEWNDFLKDLIERIEDAAEKVKPENVVGQ